MPKPTKWSQSRFGPHRTITVKLGGEAECHGEIFHSTAMGNEWIWKASRWNSTFAQRAAAYKEGSSKTSAGAKNAAKKALAKMCDRPESDFAGLTPRTNLSGFADWSSKKKAIVMSGAAYLSIGALLWLWLRAKNPGAGKNPVQVIVGWPATILAPGGE